MWGRERSKEWVQIKGIINVMQKILYTNLLVTTNQKPVIDMQRIKRKVSKCINTTKENKQTMTEQEKIREKLQTQAQHK